MAKIKGVIEALARNGKGIKIGEDWYGAFKAVQLNGAVEGSEVEFEYLSKDKGGQTFNNIQGNVNVLGKSEAPKKSGTDDAPKSGGTPGSGHVGAARDRSIVRQNSLTNANATIHTFYAGDAGGTGKSPEELAEEVIAVAKLYEAYSMLDS